MEMCQVEVWVVVDENGDYSAGASEEQASENYESEIGGGDTYSKRRIKIKLSVPKPRPLELSATVPDESHEGTLVVA